MNTKGLIFVILLMISAHSFSQRFSLGDRLSPTATTLKLIGISSKTGVSNYKYIGTIKDTYLFNRKIGEIIVGIKNGVVVTTMYNLIPENGDVGVPKSTLDLVQKTIPFPLGNADGFYGANIDGVTIWLSRLNNVITFNKDRIVYVKSLKN